MAESALVPQDAARVPQVAAASRTSLGLECLILIGRRYGLHLSVAQLVKDNRLSSAEVSFEDLLTCAERAGFRCRGLRARWATLGDMRNALPAVVLLNDGTHAVLTRADTAGAKAEVTLQRPQPGAEAETTVLDRGAFEALWTGDLLLVKRSLGLAESAEPFGLRTVVSILWGDGRLARDALVSTAALCVLALGPIVVALLMLRQVLTQPAPGTFAFLCLCLGLVVVFEAVFVVVRGRLLGRLAARLEQELSGQGFAHLLRLPMEEVEQTPLGTLAGRLGRAATVADGVGGPALMALLDAGVAVLAFVLLAVLKPWVALLVAAFLAVLIGWALVMGRRLRAAGEEVAAAEQRRDAFLSESVGAFGTVKEFSLDARQRQRWDVLTARVTRLRMAEDRVANLMQTVATPLEWLMVFGSFALAVVMVAQVASPTELGALFAVLLLTLRLAAPFRQLAVLVRDAERLRRATDELGLMMNAAGEEGHAGEGVQRPLAGRVEFNNVSFTYPGAAVPALQAVTFEAPPGTMLGIMGRSGSGKTTIARLLQKLHGDYRGLIKIDGIDARDWETDHLRGQLGVVLQETFLFSGTVRENIAAGRPDATADEVAQAARIAEADDFIAQLPLGYDTVLPEGGLTLSDGQRQRLAIARAVINEPRILILDEATAALDPETEARISANLRRFASGRTIITISHRFAALQQADTILVLDRGEVQDMGRHEELLERCDVYSGLWQRRKTLLEGATRPETLLPRGQVA